jgi:hypothetical protein
MTQTDIEAEILAIVGNRYRVQKLWKASSEAKVSRYAVFTGGNETGDLRQLTEPMSHADAQQRRGLLMVSDILDMIERLQG